MNSLGTGVNSPNRIANEVRATSVKLKIDVSQPSALTAITIPKVRMIVFWDKQANQAAPEVFGALNSTSLLVTDLAVPTLLAMYNHNNVKARYKVLWDVTFCPQAYQYTAPTVQGNRRFFNKKIKLSRRVLYDDSTTGITAIETNALWIVFMSDAAPASVDRPVIDLSWEFFFKD